MTTPMQLAQCEKCQAWVLTGQVAGINTTVNLGMLADDASIRDALLAGKSFYVEMSRKVLRYVPPKDLAKEIKGNRCFYATHECMVSGTVRARVAELTPAGTRTPVCDVWRAQGWNPPRTCPRLVLAGSQGSQGDMGLLGHVPTSCNNCEPPPFERGETVPESPYTPITKCCYRRPTRCRVCDKVITGDEDNIVAIEYDERVVWAYHVTC